MAKQGTQQQDIISALPGHLRCFVQVQDYDAYTPRDHSVWRFLMHQLRFQLAETAHPVYLEGLRLTGISIEHIPSIDDMNACLEHIGWKALGVDGFIPPAVFMEFQSRRILVIAMNMRSLEQILYTPAPDILHESAGHAPFLIDVDYAEFLQKFGEIGLKALSSKQDEVLFEAIRHLSITKENPHATKAESQEAERRLSDATAANDNSSEAALLARLHWWTVEYGLVGDLSDYKIFGAGLLSSLSESKNCLDDSRVEKKLLTINAIKQPYDITTEQPQLYVTHSCRHLSQVLDDAARGMAQTRGGASSVRNAIASETVCTLVYNSGIQVSGIISALVTDVMDNIAYVSTSGATQLAWQGEQLIGQGIDCHPDGFGSPVGQVNEFSRCLSEYSIDELRFAGIEAGAPAKLEFVSGVVVEGDLVRIERRNQKNILFSLESCQVSDATGAILFAPDWGRYDMAIGTEIVSVTGGSADPSAFQLQCPPREKTTTRHWSEPELLLFKDYQATRDLREQRSIDTKALQQLRSDILEHHADEWLLLFELFELTLLQDAMDAETLSSQLTELVGIDDSIRQLIAQGIERVIAQAKNC